MLLNVAWMHRYLITKSDGNTKNIDNELRTKIDTQNKSILK